MSLEAPALPRMLRLPEFPFAIPRSRSRSRTGAPAPKSAARPARVRWLPALVGVGLLPLALAVVLLWAALIPLLTLVGNGGSRYVG